MDGTATATDRQQPERTPATDASIIHVIDGLADDRATARALYLAVQGMEGVGADAADVEAVCELVETLEERLSERRDQLMALQRAPHRQPPSAGRQDDLLLSAFDQWMARNRADQESGDDDENRSALAGIDQAQRALERLPARTPAGVAAKLKFVLYGHALDELDLTIAFFRGEPVVDQVIARGDWRDVMLVRAIEDLERIANGGEA